MPRSSKTLSNPLRLLPRALLLAAAIAVPVLSIPAVHGSESTIIEAPAVKNSGAGFILMVSLQRS